MTSFRIDIDPESRFTAKFFGRVLEQLQAAYRDARARTGMSHAELAEHIGMDKGSLTRRMNGESNLTLRTIAQLAYRLEREIDFELPPVRESAGNKYLQRVPGRSENAAASNWSVTGTADGVRILSARLSGSETSVRPQSSSVPMFVERAEDA